MIERIYVKHYGLSDKKLCPACGQGVGGLVSLYSLSRKSTFVCAVCFMQGLNLFKVVQFVPLDDEE